jgi:hypothetical protein
MATKGSTWEQALTQHLSSLLFPSASKATWEPFGSCNGSSHEKEMPVQHRLPGFFTDKNWDLAGDSAQATTRTRHGSEEVINGKNIKPPAFFFDKSWDIGKPTEPEVDDFLPEGEHHCSFLLDQCSRFGMVLEETLEPLPHGLLVVCGLDDDSAFRRTDVGTIGIRAGDVIIEVEGHRGSASQLREALVQHFSQSGRRMLNLVVRSRPSAFNIEVWRGAGEKRRKTGFTSTVDRANPDCLVVESIKAKGLVPAWNAAHGSLRICKGDLITHVNGSAQDVDAMTREIDENTAKRPTLRLRVVTRRGLPDLLKAGSDEEPDSPWPLTTVPWDMQVTWLNDTMSEVSTTGSLERPLDTYHREFTSGSSGSCTPVDLMSIQEV